MSNDEYVNVQFGVSFGVTGGIMVGDDGVIQLWLREEAQNGEVTMISYELNGDDREQIIHILTNPARIATEVKVLDGEGES